MKIWLAALLLLLSNFVQAEVWRFAVIGDVPYSEVERQQLPSMLSAIAASKASFVAHIGDFKHGKDRCDDELFADRHAIFNAAAIPFIYVPGDNEWTDCERLSNGAYDPQERLNKLRHLFFSNNFSLGQIKLPLERQSGAYPEHARFQLGPVLFVTLNLPGGNNNYGLTSDPKAEFVQRNPVTLRWMKDSFARARRDGLSAVVLLFQANPGFKHFSQGLAHRGFRDLLEALRDETLHFSGQVVVIHGDTHISRIDQPLRDKNGRTLQRFIRVETFGYPIMGWTEGVIDSESPSLFNFQTHPWKTINN